MIPSGRTLRARRFAPVDLAPLGCIYHIQRAVADKATVPIYYESRIAKLGLNASELPKLNPEFEEIIRQCPDEEQKLQAHKLKTKCAALRQINPTIPAAAPRRQRNERCAHHDS